MNESLWAHTQSPAYASREYYTSDIGPSSHTPNLPLEDNKLQVLSMVVANRARRKDNGGMKHDDTNEQPGVREVESSIHTDFSKDMSYADYLGLEQLLTAQRPVSDAHDEMLFIILHQASELWIKLMVFEVQAAKIDLQRDQLKNAFKKLARVSRIQAQMIQSWDVLSTLTPADYLTFRAQLGHSSGFQSYQYRELEFLLGNKNRGHLKPHEHDSAVHAHLTEVLESPSLYDEALMLLHRRGHHLPPEVVDRDWSEPYTESEAVLDVWSVIYQDTEVHWELYEMAEKLVDLEDWFQQWRFRHMKTVERIIGFKVGTGGSSGVPFLQKALSIRVFPELWSLRTKL